jgi:hypothetical protein
MELAVFNFSSTITHQFNGIDAMESARIVTAARTALCANAEVSVTISPDQLLYNGRAVI